VVVFHANTIPVTKRKPGISSVAKELKRHQYPAYFAYMPLPVRHQKAKSMNTMNQDAQNAEKIGMATSAKYPA
jgi:hypothetical protein